MLTAGSRAPARACGGRVLLQLLLCASCCSGVRGGRRRLRGARPAVEPPPSSGGAAGGGAAPLAAPSAGSAPVHAPAAEVGTPHAADEPGIPTVDAARACRLSPPARDHPGSCFVCRHCNSSRDCGEAASNGRLQQDREWRLARADGHYHSDELNDERLCLRKWMIGCSGPNGLEVCNSYTESCAESDALYDEGVRDAKYSVCSEAAFMSPSTVTLVFTIPIVLSVLLGVSTVGALVHSFHSGLCTCPPAPSRVPVLLAACTLLVFSCLCFFSPYFGAGIVGAVVANLSLFAHSVAIAADEAQAEGKEGATGDKTQKWLVAATASCVVSVYLIWGQGYPAQAGHSDTQLGQACADFYHFFVVDPRLRGPDHNKEVRFWGYCERGYIADTLWNVTAVVWLSLLLGAMHLLALAGVAYRHRDEDRGRFGSNNGVVDLSQVPEGRQSNHHHNSTYPFTYSGRERHAGMSHALLRPSLHSGTMYSSSAPHGTMHHSEMQVTYTDCHAV
eukprot:TRINITY_DN27088_c0_g1_i1.p2 TRINITY_DN27088_c0_g1~~TRINITY_DN27088_c0_g1_i1.p2  ORF type:complete len:536 (+),score=158.13 TRINITY_DN27088_c0_g1_i1:98-1609(+)